MPRQLYGLMTALPALQLEKPAPPPWQAVYTVAAPLLEADELRCLTALYYPAEHRYSLQPNTPRSAFLPCLFDPEDQEVLPYADQERVMELRKMPLSAALAALQVDWESYVHQFDQDFLNEWLQCSHALQQYRLGWLISEKPVLSRFTKSDPLPALSVLEQQLEPWFTTQQLQQLVHEPNMASEERLTDALLWDWLDNRLFHEPFSFNALLGYAIKQQYCWKWYHSAEADTRHYLETSVQQMIS
jgi:hypothetical protein